MLEALVTVLGDALPHADSAYVVGFDDNTATQLLGRMGQGEQFTRVNSAKDLDAGARAVVVAGPGWEASLSDAAGQSFADRLAALNVALVRGGTLAVYVPNTHSLADLLDGQRLTHPEETNRYDSTLPHSPAELEEALHALGHSAVNVHTVFGGTKRWTSVSKIALEQARPGDVVTHAVARALEAQVRAEHRLMDAADLVDRLTASGTLAYSGSAFLALVGGRGRSLYAATDDGQVQWLDRSSTDTRWGVGSGSAQADGVMHLPVAPSVASALLEAIHAEDTQAFRALATRVGVWAAQSSQLDGMTGLDWRDVLVNEDEIALSLSLTGDRTRRDTGAPTRDELLAGAWRRFIGVARHNEPNLPWPATWSDDELLRMWLSMSAVDESRIDALIAASDAQVGPPDVATVRDALVTVENLRQQNASLSDEIAGLHETLRQRDEELAIRGRAILSLRLQARNAAKNREMMERANHDIKNSATFKLANQFRKVALVTRPKKLVKTVGKEAEKRVKSLRRVG